MTNHTLDKDDADYSEDSFFQAEEKQIFHFDVPNDAAGKRLDVTLALLLPDYSRSRLSEWIKEGAVMLNGKQTQPKQRLIGSEKICVTVPPSPEYTAFVGENIPVDCIYEDEDVLVINKPAGLVVHPAAGNWSGTLLNGLLFHYPELQHIPRAGIVHRLDKDTSGLMVVARNLPAQNALVQQLQARTVKRTYRAIANGIVPFDGKIETRIGRHPHQRQKMAVVSFGGKEAITHVRVLAQFLSHSYIECSLETGRTHQIRVHMREAKHPLAGDAVYGDVRHPCSDAVKETLLQLNRQALHAYRLAFVHPRTGILRRFQAALPEDMRTVLAVLQDEYHAQNGCLNIIEDDDDDDVMVMYVRD